MTNTSADLEPGPAEAVSREGRFFADQTFADFEKALVNARGVTTRIFDGSSGGAGHWQPSASAS